MRWPPFPWCWIPGARRSHPSQSIQVPLLLDKHSHLIEKKKLCRLAQFLAHCQLWLCRRWSLGVGSGRLSWCCKVLQCTLLYYWLIDDFFSSSHLLQYYRGAGSLSLSSMQQLVSAGHPIIVNVLDGAHWVLVVGFSGSTFAVNDPAAFHTTYDYSGMSNFVVYNV